MTAFERRHPPSSTAPSVVLQGLVSREVLAANPTGSTDKSVALIDGGDTQIGSVALASWVKRTDSATLGTTWEVLQRGTYLVNLHVPVTDPTVEINVSYNAPTGVRQGKFAPFDDSVYANNAVIVVTGADIAAGTNVLRGHIGDGTGKAPAAGVFFAPLNCCMRITRMGDAA